MISSDSAVEIAEGIVSDIVRGELVGVRLVELNGRTLWLVVFERRELGPPGSHLHLGPIIVKVDAEIGEAEIARAT